MRAPLKTASASWAPSINIIIIIIKKVPIVESRGFIKVLNRRATEFDTRAKNWQGPPLGGIRGHAPPENFEIL